MSVTRYTHTITLSVTMRVMRKYCWFRKYWFTDRYHYPARLRRAVHTTRTTPRYTHGLTLSQHAAEATHAKNDAVGIDQAAWRVHVSERRPLEKACGRWWPRTGGRGPRAGVGAPGRRGGGASQQVAASGRAASDRGVGEGGRRGLRIADTHLPGGERKTA